jgi:hypothetical protein
MLAAAVTSISAELSMRMIAKEDLEVAMQENGASTKTKSTRKS